MRRIVEYLFPAVKRRREEREKELEALDEKWRAESMEYYEKLAMIQNEITRRAKLHEQHQRNLTALRKSARHPKPSRRVMKVWG